MPMSVADIRAGLQKSGKVVQKVTFTDIDVPPNVWIRRWPLGFYQKVNTALVETTQPLKELQNDALVNGLCSEGGDLLYDSTADALSQLEADCVVGPVADQIYTQMLDYNGFKAKPEADAAQGSLDEAKNSSTTETLGS